MLGTESVGHVRKHLGKVERAGMAKKMEYVYEKIPTQPTDEHVSQDLRSGSTTEKQSQSRRFGWLKNNLLSIRGHDQIHNDDQL